MRTRSVLTSKHADRTRRRIGRAKDTRRTPTLINRRPRPRPRRNGTNSIVARRNYYPVQLIFIYEKKNVRIKLIKLNRLYELKPRESRSLSLFSPYTIAKMFDDCFVGVFLSSFLILIVFSITETDFTSSGGSGGFGFFLVIAESPKF